MTPKRAKKVLQDERSKIQWRKYESVWFRYPFGVIAMLYSAKFRRKLWFAVTTDYRQSPLRLKHRMDSEL